MVVARTVSRHAGDVILEVLVYRDSLLANAKMLGLKSTGTVVDFGRVGTEMKARLQTRSDIISPQSPLTGATCKPFLPWTYLEALDDQVSTDVPN
jgi:hypothetical protein